MLLFKYLNPDVVGHVFEREREIALKFGLPRSFNDPYELFLQADKPLSSDEAMAFYEYFLREIPQLPVTCFSRDPHSIVMWAHYARDAKGICLGFDEDVLVDTFPIAYIDDVSYSKEPAQIKSSLVEYAFATGKRRHTLRMIAVATRAVYFMKRLAWRYENERRLVVDPGSVQTCNGNLIARVPVATLRYIIIGQNTEESLQYVCKAKAGEAGVPLLQFRIGKRRYEPFFSDGNQHSYWNGKKFESISSVCLQCGDPDIVSPKGTCRWCGVSEESRRKGPMRSMLAATLHYGIDKGIPMHFDGLPRRGYLAREAIKEVNSRSKDTNGEWEF